MALVRLQGAYSVGTPQASVRTDFRYPHSSLTHTRLNLTLCRLHLSPQSPSRRSATLHCWTIWSDSRHATLVSQRAHAVGMPSKPALPAISPLHRPDVLADRLYLVCVIIGTQGSWTSGRQSSIDYSWSEWAPSPAAGSRLPSRAIYCESTCQR